MFWNKCLSKERFIIFGQPQAEFTAEVDLKGLANSFKKVQTRINKLDTTFADRFNSVEDMIRAEGSSKVNSIT